ncbi:cysteine-rich motor neuron 1 protein [Contarinia nasturtii]|uniref:cysteine-rich motor neuron 1 protein n=1 Tax=Contarinia nasturtii TaxID=265458 RepID=UPI0012D39BE9|nr:cysteine-rich motor neuron 1 protein [Contarinia nasturtii]XP_031622409.1 cysteine-rich motor neuron 1 protein [Contarinia nasturtii]XP_031622410.1 cysteine-rich motor neuron 1 protein [Contarinia nasturtii]
MITIWHQDDYNRNDGFGQQHQQTNISNKETEHNHSIYLNRNRNKHIILLLIAILICKCCAVTGDSTEPPDCSSIVCDLKCPADSKVIRIDSYDSIILPVNGSETPIHETNISKQKRAILTRQRETIKIVPAGDYVRRRRDVINDTISSPSSLASQKCCECKCDFSKCPDLKCPSNEYKITIAPGSQVPGSCCTKYHCSKEKPTCYSAALRRHFNAFEHWNEDSCTHCECTETGETNCIQSSCKPLNCAKKQEIEGECCPVCDHSDSKFCDTEIDCELHCRNGYEFDPVRDCAICTCVKTITSTIKTTTIALEDFSNNTVAIVPTTTTTVSTTTTTASPTTTSKSSDRITETVTESDVQTDNNNSSTKPYIDEDENWTFHMPIVMGICITIGAFLIIVSLTCRHISNNKDKHHLNRKQNTPLI